MEIPRVAKRRDFELALLAALIAVPGCAGKPLMPWGADKPTRLEELAARNAAPAKTSWTEKLAIKPKVIPAEDQTSLSSKPKKLGADLFIQAARVHEGKGNVDDAKAQYAKALEVEPKNVSALVGLARLHDREQRFADAEKLYRQAAQLDPNNAVVWNDLGLCYARQQRIADAVKTLDQAIKLQPANKMYRNNMATVLVEAGRTDDAWAHLTAGNPPAVAHYNMACLLRKQQRTDVAVEHLHLAVQIDPSLKPAAQLLAQLEGRSTTREQVAAKPVDVAPVEPAPSYVISDTAARNATQSDMLATTPRREIIDPLIPSTRRSATFRMPPVDDHSDDPAPQPKRLPPPDAEPQVELGHPGGDFPSRQIAHDEGEVQQPRNVIKLLGTEPITAPIPKD
jgi:Flp pilus assembly protein TadD